MADLFGAVQRRIVLSYAAVMTVTLLLLGPLLYLSFSQQITTSADAALRLAAQRQAALALVGSGLHLGISNRFSAPAPLTQRTTFYLLLTPAGRVRANPGQVRHAGLPDGAVARLAARRRAGVFSTLATHDAGDVRLFTVPILRGQRVVSVLQAGQSLAPVAAARRSLLIHLIMFGAVAVGAATVGARLLARQAVRPATAVYTAQKAFIADASHELRTPLTLLRTNAEVLLHGRAVTAPEAQTLLVDMVALTERMDGLIADLLTLARLDSGTLPIEYATVALDTLVATSVRQMMRLAERHGVRLDLGEVSPLLIRGDAAKLERLVVILLTNGIAYNRPGGRVAVSVRRANDQALLVVCDTGLGIPASEVPRLFARFHRGPGTRASTEGSGLGLAIAHGIVQAHHGHIHVTSEVGVGSTFTISLPLLAHRDGVRAHAAGQHPAEATEIAQ